MKITYPVPAETTSVFVVVTDRTPTELSSIVPWRMGRPHRRTAMEALGTPRLELEAFRAAQSPWRRMDLDGDDIRKQVRRARHHIVVSSIAPVTAQPEAAQVARAAARGVAEAYHGVIVDPLTGTALTHCPQCPGERQEFRLGDDWLGWTSEVDETGSCPPWEPAASGLCSCLRVTTRGLRRFGLPEIMLDGAACAHSLCTVDILRAVADRLLLGHLDWITGHPGAPCRTIGEHLRIGQADFAVFSGSPDLDDEPFRVRLTRDAADRSCLRIGPPDGFDGTVNDWLCRTPGILAA
ncbi:hypothetical protein [Sphaerimonospora thailandensis]|uniref:Uncharacterized protein n=1 Tax=Sphaerimonospora thailandensis TaxID=795644 RepID=A0A8J3VXH4_9ACTN|nr:hypothetical protein [Sphaerimonospora thailandensis]GIH68959.1 hypothetical protein Mth01_12120 [Sphaerimonospora thailandensis]